jgi:hypothetical protein
MATSNFVEGRCPLRFKLRIVTRIVLKVDAVVNYVYAAICAYMLATYCTVSAERDKMCQTHPESQDPGENMRKTIPRPRERLGCRPERQIRRCLLSGYLKATNQAWEVAKIAGIIIAQFYNGQYG